MFYVYDAEGLNFKGSLEFLEKQRLVNRRMAVPPIHENRRLASFAEPKENPETPESQVTKAYQESVRPKNMVEPLVYAFQIMSSPVVTIPPSISLVDVWQMLKEKNMRQVVVLSEENKLLGVLSDRDILRRINIVNDEVEVQQNIVVGEVIQKETITTDLMNDIRRVARVMAFYHIDAMPVMQEEKLVGIVTRGDILRGFAEHQKLNLWA